jgi:hypothetical protein
LPCRRKHLASTHRFVWPMESQSFFHRLPAFEPFSKTSAPLLTSTSTSKQIHPSGQDDIASQTKVRLLTATNISTGLRGCQRSQLCSVAACWKKRGSLPLLQADNDNNETATTKSTASIIRTACQWPASQWRVVKSPQLLKFNLRRFAGMSRRVYWTPRRSAASYFDTMVENIFSTIAGTFATVIPCDVSLWYKK